MPAVTKQTTKKTGCQRGASAAVVLGVLTFLGSGCGAQEEWHDAQACMVERGAVAVGPSNFTFRDSSGDWVDDDGDNGFQVRVNDSTQWAVSVFFFDDEEAARQAIEAYRRPVASRSRADPLVYRSGRVFAVWDTVPSWIVQQAATGVPKSQWPPHPRPPGAIRESIVDGCLTQQ